MATMIKRDTSAVSMILYSSSKAKLSIKVVEATLQRGCMSSSGISIGTSIAHQLDLKCQYASWMKSGASFYFEIRNTSSNKTLYWKKFRIAQVEGDKEIVTITAYGPLYSLQALPFSMSVLDEVSVNPAEPTYRDVIAAVEQIAMSFYKDYGETYTVRFTKGSNKIWSATANKLPSEGILQLKQYNCRQVLEYCAGACGANVFDYYDVNGVTDFVSNVESRSFILIDFPLKNGEDVSNSLYKDGLKMQANSAQAVDRLVVTTFQQVSGWSVPGDRESVYTRGVSESNSVCAVQMENPIVNKKNVDLIWSILSGWAFYTSEVQLFGNVWLDETKKYYCYSGDNTVDANMVGFAPVMQVSTTIDGGMKSTWTCTGQAEQAGNQSGGASADKILLQNITEVLHQIHNMDIDGSRIKDSTINNSKFANGSITGSKIDFSTFEDGVINGSAINGSTFKSGSIEGSVIKDSTLSGAKIKDATISFEKVDQSFINDLTADSIFTKSLKSNIGEFGYITSADADLKYANIGLTNIQDGTIKNAMIGNAQISFEKVDQSFIKNLTADNIFTQLLKSLVGEFGFISADEAALKYTDIYLSNIDTANINKANIGLLFNAVGLIDRATIVDGHVTGFLDGVQVNANKITSGTLATDRLIIRNPDDPTKSIIYEINNITGALQAVQGETINGEVMTPRTVNADKIVAGSVTTTELDVAQIFADSAVLRQIFTQDITATGTIRGIKLIGVSAEIEEGKIGGWTITKESLYSASGNNHISLYANGKFESSYMDVQNGTLVTETYKSLKIQAGDIFMTSGAVSNKDNNDIELSLDNGLQLNNAKDTWIKISGGIIQTKYGSIVGYSANGFVIKPNDADAGEIGSKGCYFKTMYSSKYALRDSTYGIEIGTTSSGGSSGVRIGDLSGGNGSYTYITNDCVAQHAMRVEGTLTVNGGSVMLGNSASTVHIPGTLDNPIFNAIGTYSSASKAVNITHGNVDSYVIGASVTLSAGTYLVIARGIFASNQTQAIRRVSITVDGSASSLTSQITWWWSALQCVSVVTLTASKQVACAISAGVAISGCSTEIKAVRIK